MLKDLDAIVEYTQRFECEPQSTRARMILQKPGCSDAEIAQIVLRMPELPESYLRVASYLQLTNRTIGYLELSPGSHHKALWQQLLDANDAASPWIRQVAAHGCRIIASWEREPIAVVCTGKTHTNGQILIFDYDDPNRAPVFLASNFENLLLAAGNLDEIRSRYMLSGNRTGAVPELLGCLDRLAIACTPQSLNEWCQVAQEVIR